MLYAVGIQRRKAANKDKEVHQKIGGEKHGIPLRLRKVEREIHE